MHFVHVTTAAMGVFRGHGNQPVLVEFPVNDSEYASVQIHIPEPEVERL